MNAVIERAKPVEIIPPEMNWWVRMGRSLRKSPVGIVGVVIVGVILLLAIFGPLITPFDPLETNLRSRFQAPGFTNDKGVFWLGTDQLGRDILSRIILGSQISVLVGVMAVAIAGTIGVLLGLIAGFYGGWVDSVIMRITDGLLSIPFIVLVIAIAGVVGSGLTTLIMVLGLTSWVTYTRVIRGEVLKVRSLDYIVASYAIGQRNFAIIMRHILPNVISSGIILAATQVGITILAESSLSFLGLGVDSSTVTWGMMLSDGRNYINSAWWMTTYPGIAITITVLGVILLGDWLRDVLDPNLRGRG